MASPYNFRSAFSGFNREDVVHYIEYVNSNHNNQINQLKSDIAALRQENAALRSAPIEKSKVEELEAQVEALRRELAEVTAQRDAAVNTQAKACTDEELEAYRRAERTERLARERTEIMYQKAHGVLADAAARVDAATGQISDIANLVNTQLAALQDAVGSSKLVFDETAAALSSITPNE